MSQIELDRNAVKEKAKRQSLIADMKQHADKLIRGFEKMDDSYSKRAVWELVQNARDLSEKSEIEILLYQDRFVFSHNGKPFTSNTLLSLIKQVSSKSPDNADSVDVSEDEVKEVGQYGTGFITTHAFGKRFLLNGSLEVEEGIYIDLNDFEIDRVAPNSLKLAEKLSNQELAVYDLIDTGTITNDIRPTTFKYLFDEPIEKEKASLAISHFTDFYVPIVMTLNTHVKSVRLEDHTNDIKKFYTKGLRETENGVTSTQIFLADEPITIYSVYSNIEEIEIILPLVQTNKAKFYQNPISKLFLYFPLIGTEAWGTNFIIHCGRFSPTEPRDGLHLKSDNSQTREKENNNFEILMKASEMIFNFMENHADSIADPIILSEIAFDTISGTPLLNAFYKELKFIWVDKFRGFSLIDTNFGRKSPKDAAFLDPIFLKSDGHLVAIYTVVSKFWNNLPDISIVKQWTEIIQKWEDGTAFVTLTEVAKRIENEADLSGFDEKSLRIFYEYLIEIKQTAIFDEFKLLPNIKNSFEKKTELYIAKSIDDILIRCADVIIPAIPRKFINKGFTLSNTYLEYTRKQLTSAIKAKCDEEFKEISTKYQLNKETRDALILFSTTYPSLDNKGVRGPLIDLIAEYYKVEINYYALPNIENDEIDYFPILKCLTKSFLYDMIRQSQQNINWVEENILIVAKVLELLEAKQFEDIIKVTPIFPNQNYKLVMLEKLKRPENIPDGLIELHNDVIGGSVQDILSHDICMNFVPAESTKTGGVLALEINAQLQVEGSYTNISVHPKKKIILDIIDRITADDSIWGSLFQDINNQRATIMMATIANAEIKDNMFNILKLEPKNISLLGSLAENQDDLSLIIQFGKERLEDERNRESDFQFKKGIGEHIESLLRARVQKGVNDLEITVDVLEKQGGQDIIVRRAESDEPLYRIEVKSRWSSEYSTTMSNAQIKTAVQFKDNYALCCVNMVDYYPDDSSRSYPEEFDKISVRVRVLQEIGYAIEPLIQNALKFDDMDEQVRLTGDYKITISTKLVNTGLTFQEFIEFLVKTIEPLLI